MKKLTLFVALGLFLTACQKEPLQIPSDEPTARQQLLNQTIQGSTTDGLEEIQSMGKAPGQSGPNVFRVIDGIAEIGLIFADAKSNLTAIVGLDNELFCSTFQLDYDLIPLQDVLGTSREDRIIRLQKGEVQTIVYEGVWPEFSPVCNFTNTAPIMAQGTSRLVINDNDLLVWQTDENKNHNSFSYKAHGTLTDANGEEVLFNGHANGVWDGNNDETFGYNSIRVILR